MDEFSLYQWLVLGLLTTIAFLLWADVAGRMKDLQIALVGELRDINSDALTEIHGVLKTISAHTRAIEYHTTPPRLDPYDDVTLTK